MSSRRSLLIFARFYELQALTAEGLKASPGALRTVIKEPKTKNVSFWTKNLEVLSFYPDFFLEPRFTVRYKPDRDPESTSVDLKHCRNNSVFFLQIKDSFILL
jgi:hypothetical protein